MIYCSLAMRRHDDIYNTKQRDNAKTKIMAIKNSNNKAKAKAKETKTKTKPKPKPKLKPKATAKTKTKTRQDGHKTAQHSNMQYMTSQD
jgi:hypothetical protein